jgi:non-specific serine/threonine protein kinase
MDAGGDPVRRVHDFLAAHSLAELPDDIVRLGDVWNLCERCVAAGDTAASEALYARLAAFAARAEDGCAGVWSTAAAHYLGLLAAALARWDTAAAHFEDALQLCARRGAALEAARTQSAYARLLLASGDAADARKAYRLIAELIAGSQALATTPAMPRTPEPGTPAARGRPPAPTNGGARCRYVFRREGDYWTLAGDGHVVRVRSMRGFDYLIELLRHPHEAIYVVDLAGVGAPGERRLTAAEAAENGLRVSGEGGIAEALDQRARSDYRARWRELLAEAEEAQRDNDVGRVARLQHEIEMLRSQLAAARGGANGRGAPSFKERARVNVRNCISAALRAISKHDEMLWRHLRNSIKTGTFCCYAPDRPVEWEM